MTRLFSLLLIFTFATTAAHAEKRAVFLNARKVEFEKEWSACWGRRSPGETFKNCVRRVAISAAAFLEDNVNFYRDIIQKRQYAPGDDQRKPPLDGNVNLAQFNDMYQVYLDFRDSQCRFESVRHSVTDETEAYLQKARCHFRTAFGMAFVVADSLGI